MSKDEIFEVLKGILVDKIDVEAQKVVPQARFENDLEMDSVELVKLVMYMNKTFGTKLTPKDALTIKSVGDAVDFVAAHSG
jgi:acyl carrier protein